MAAAELAPVAAAISAIAAAFSARSSRLAVSSANTPYVWPAIRIGRTEDRIRTVYIRLHNDGPGVAFGVRCSTHPDDPADSLYSTPPIRAMRSGEVVPPHPEPQVQPTTRDGDEYRLAILPDTEHPIVAVRYDGGLGRSWEVRAPLDSHEHISRPKRLRRGRMDLWRPTAKW